MSFGDSLPLEDFIIRVIFSLDALIWSYCISRVPQLEIMFSFKTFIEALSINVQLMKSIYCYGLELDF